MEGIFFIHNTITVTPEYSCKPLYFNIKLFMRIIITEPLYFNIKFFNNRSLTELSYLNIHFLPNNL